MKAHTGIELSAEDVERAYHGILHFTDSLDKYKYWLKDESFVVLPGFEEAVKQVEAETAKYQELSMRIYLACFNPKNTQEA